MYKLELTQEEFHWLKGAVMQATVKAQFVTEKQALQDILNKLVVSQINAEDEVEREAEGQRYAANLHARPEGA
jgi:hypothetical protein